MSIRLLSIDFETRSPVDLKVAGVARYCEHPDTDVWCLAYETEEGVKVWQREDHDLPASLAAAIQDGAYIRAWNAAFERTIWREIMVKRYGWPTLPTERFVCAMAMAAAASLPLSLDAAAIALRLQEKKDRDGHKLMLRMCKPRKVLTPDVYTNDGRLVQRGTFEWWDEPEKRARLGAYCAQDVRTESEAWSKLPPAMNARERKIWLMDQCINDRGLRLDLPLVVAARHLVERVQPIIDQRVAEITGGITVTQVAKLTAWLTTQGVEPESLSKASVTAMLTDPTLTPDVRTVLEARQAGAKSSTSKYAAMLAAVCADGRVKGSMQYYGATTGRWAGRGIQPHNFPNPTRRITPEILADILAGDIPWLEAMYGPVLPLLSNALRSCFIPAEGKQLAVADYSTIEARIVAWLAGQDDLIEAFRRDAKIYEEFAGSIFDVDWRTIAKEDPMRQAGKIGVLGCGFGMGPVRASEQYGIEMTLARKIVKHYRETYARIPELWNHMNQSANAATLGHGEVIVPNTNGRLRFEAKGGYLLLHLPSGRPLWYHAPVVRTYMVRREEEREYRQTEQVPEGARFLSSRTDENGEYQGLWLVDTSFEATGVECSTLHPVTKQWIRQTFYGGLWTENAVQACARDVMADAMLRCEAKGIPVVLSVHDEIVAEVEPEISARSFVDLLTELPQWASGCPISASGWVEDRYRK